MQDTKLLFLDIDGTLINSQKEITPRTKSAIQRVQDLGLTVVLISARMPKSLQHICRLLDIPENTVAFNGSNTRLSTLGGHTMELPAERLLSHTLVEQCHDIAKHYPDTSINIYTADHWLTNNADNRWTQREMNNTMVTADLTDLSSANIRDYLSGLLVHKVLLRSNPLVVEQIAADFINEQLHTLANTTNTRSKLIELTPHNINKGKAIEDISIKTGIPLEQMMAFGDADNDIEMLETVGYGFAMEGCSDRLRRAAYEVVGSNNEDGVAKVLEQLFQM